MANQITIGRNPQSTIVVDARYVTVSGNHATILRSGANFILEDHSTNGSYVNGQKVHNSSATIRPGDRVTLGQQYVLNLNELMQYLGGNETQHIPQNNGVMPESHMAIAIISLILGISIPICLILSIIAIIKASSVESRWRNGDYQGAREASHKAQNLGWWSIAVGILLVVIYLILFLTFLNGEI